MTTNIDLLAADIRAIDGNHDKGAGAIAEALIARGWVMFDSLPNYDQITSDAYREGYNDGQESME